MHLSDIQSEVHSTAVEHGWWEEDPGLPEKLCLIHSEVSEALEEYRSGHLPNEVYYGAEKLTPKPEGIGIELADVIIRVLDYCEYVGINMEEMLRLKMDYNATRPYRHGNKVC